MTEHCFISTVSSNTKTWKPQWCISASAMRRFPASSIPLRYNMANWFKTLSKIRVCSKCGVRLLDAGHDRHHRLYKRMTDENLCHECAYWLDLIESPGEYLEVIDGVCYRIYPMADKRDCTVLLGGKGIRRFFARKDLTPFESNDIWLVGAVPQRFIEHFPDTAFEITRYGFNRLSVNHKRCKARLCFDRYHCLRYMTELESNGPLNEIPNNWRVGNEHCPPFINKAKALLNKNPNNNT